MKEFIYEPRGYAGKYYFDSFDKAVAKMLEDEGYNHIDDYIDDLIRWEVNFSFDDYVSFSSDDGPHISEVTRG